MADQISVDLAGRGLSEIPDDIFSQTTVEMINLRHNKIKTLPTNFGLCFRATLKRLWLWGNRFTDFPEVVLQLSNLEILDLRENCICRLPANISVLQKLQKLWLCENKLDSLPDSICDMENLTEFMAHRNNISTLPFGFGRLKLKHLNLDNNPLVQPPLEVCLEGISAIAAYQRELEEAKMTVSVPPCMKIVVLGKLMAGKTSLVAALTRAVSRLAKEEARTHCMEVKRWVVDVTEFGKNIDAQEFVFEVYDVGGHDAYQNVLPFFVSAHALQVLAVDLSEYRTEEFEGVAGYWVRTVTARAPGATVCVVGTKTDRLGSQEQVDMMYNKLKHDMDQMLDAERSQLRREIERLEKALEEPFDANNPSTDVDVFSDAKRSSVRERLAHLRRMEELQPKIVLQNTVSSSDELEGIAQLKETILSLATDQKLFPHVRSSIPKSWTLLLDLFESARANNRNNAEASLCLPFDRVREMGKTVSLSGENLTSALVYLHETGRVLYFKDSPSLQKYVFHSPTALIRVLRAVQHHDVAQLFDPAHSGFDYLSNSRLQKARENLDKHGLVRTKELKVMLREHVRTEAEVHAVLSLVEKFGLCYRLGTEEISDTIDRPTEWYRFPRPSTTVDYNTWCEDVPEGVEELQIGCRVLGSFPTGLFQRLCSNAHKFLQYRNGMSTGMSLTHTYAHIPGNPWEDLSAPDGHTFCDPGARSLYTQGRSALWDRADQVLGSNGTRLVHLQHRRDKQTSHDHITMATRGQAEDAPDLWAAVLQVHHELELLMSEYLAVVSEFYVTCHHCLRAGVEEPHRFPGTVMKRPHAVDIGTVKCPIADHGQVNTALVLPPQECDVHVSGVDGPRQFVKNVTTINNTQIYEGCQFGNNNEMTARFWIRLLDYGYPEPCLMMSMVFPNLGSRHNIWAIQKRARTQALRITAHNNATADRTPYFLDFRQDIMGRKMRHLLIFLLIILKEFNIPEAGCSCSSSSSTCLCRSKRLTSIPQKLPKSVSKLDLTGNKIGKIRFGVFVNLRQLERLWLSHNQITEIYSGAFTYLHQLVKLVLDYNQIRKIESQTITESDANTTATVPTSIYDQRGQGQSQTITESNTNTTATVPTSIYDQRGQGQSQTITESNTNGLVVGIAIILINLYKCRIRVRHPPSGINPTGVGSNTNTAVSVIGKRYHDQTGQGQSRGDLTEVRCLSHNNALAALQANPMYADIETPLNDQSTSGENQTSQGQSQTITESDTKTTATVITSICDQTGQGQSQTITDSATKTTATVTSISDQTGQTTITDLESNTNITATAQFTPIRCKRFRSSFHRSRIQVASSETLQITLKAPRSQSTSGVVSTGFTGSRFASERSSAVVMSLSPASHFRPDSDNQHHHKSKTSLEWLTTPHCGSATEGRVSTATGTGGILHEVLPSYYSTEAILTGFEGCQMPEAGCSCSSSPLCQCRNLGLTSIPHNLPTSISKLDLSSNQIVKVQVGAFAKLPGLQELQLFSNKITMIHFDTFANLVLLRELSLSSNQITKIHAGTFANLPRLQELYLSNNQITTIEPGAFANLPKLRWVALSRNQTSVGGAVAGIVLMIGTIILIKLHTERKNRHPHLGLNPKVIGGNTNTAVSVIGNCHNQAGQGQSQVIEKSNMNTTLTITASFHDQTGQGQSQSITVSNMNTTAAAITSIYDQTGQGQSQAVTESNTNTTATAPTSIYDQTGQGQSQTITVSNMNTTAAAITSIYDQTGQGQSQAITESNMNTTATIIPSIYDQTLTGQGQSQVITESNTNTTATIPTSTYDQTGQGQSQAITESNTNTTSTVPTSIYDTEPLHASNLTYGTGP
ncbi:hypothetical protein Bbelb_041940 [Branchiostoma belcheri]|nr:hypothetical protein Bbelb_041940 [Branchiostoma belcheri]